MFLDLEIANDKLINDLIIKPFFKKNLRKRIIIVQNTKDVECSQCNKIVVIGLNSETRI